MREEAPRRSGDLDAETIADAPDPFAATAIGPREPTHLVASGSSGDSILVELAGWDRYRLTKRLGAGAMGEVFHAVDLRLNRPVALKFLLVETGDLANRLAEEAQAQARVDHPHVCKVYEVGAVLGHCYIAMQFVSGKTLADAAGEMSLEEKMLVVASVAEGLHAAHRQGLIHRDVKPHNVLVERGEDGAWKPYITDFGLARDLSRTDKTVSSTAGTPLYMAPEQILGEVQSFDRRTDVYALGATLYELATGRPPFDGNLPMFVARVLHEEPKSLRSIVPSIHADLDAIVLKCLEKESERRYDTARALAEDLRRWLDGEPVLARRASFSYRAKKRIARHKALAAVSLLAFLTATTLGVAFVRERLAAREASSLGEELGRETEAVDGIMRVAALLPVHDLRTDKALVRVRMLAMENRLQGANEASKGPIEHALGRASLALGEVAEARTHLEAAERAGLRTPALRHALGLALGELYRRARAEAAKLPPGEERRARERDLDVNLRVPASAALRAGAAPASAYAEGLLAFFEGRSDEALAKARVALAEDPWSFEAWTLEGDVLLARAGDERAKGDLVAARTDLASSHEAFRAASAIARSYERAYEGDCARAIELMQIEEQQGGSLQPPFESARAACEEALRIDPKRASAFDELSEAEWRFGDFERVRGGDSKGPYEEAERAAREALRADPLDVEAHRNLALSLQCLSVESRARGGDPSRLLAEARRTCEEGLALEPRSTRLENALALIHRELAADAEERGGDPRPDLAHAIDCLSRAAQIEPRAAFYFNRSTAWGTWADYQVEHGLPPGSPMDLALEDALKAYDLDTSHPMLSKVLAEALKRRADDVRRRGGDAVSDLAKAVERYESALALKPDYLDARLGLATTQLTWASVAVERGEDPSTPLAAARASYALALGLGGPEAPREVTAFEIEAVAARAALAAHADAGPPIEAAQHAFNRLLELGALPLRQEEMRLRLLRLRAEETAARSSALKDH